MSRKFTLVTVLIIVFAGVIGDFAFLQYDHREKILSNRALAKYINELSACGAYPNNSTQSIFATSLHVIYLPTSIYPTPVNKLNFITAIGTATSSWLSPGIPTGTPTGCYQYYYKFDGKGVVNLTAVSAIKGIPDYLVHFVVAPVYTGKSIIYTNSQYGFTFTLPASWHGYSILPTTWSGSPNCLPGRDCPTVETGTEILILNPRWSSHIPYQAIPIMVFTLNQWKVLLQGKFLVDAGPIGPAELGHNTRYVFALPPRYNDRMPEGWQEVELIMASNPLHAF